MARKFYIFSETVETNKDDNKTSTSLITILFTMQYIKARKHSKL